MHACASQSVYALIVKIFGQNYVKWSLLKQVNVGARWQMDGQFLVLFEIGINPAIFVWCSGPIDSGSWYSYITKLAALEAEGFLEMKF